MIRKREITWHVIEALEHLRRSRRHVLFFVFYFLFAGKSGLQTALGGQVNQYPRFNIHCLSSHWIRSPVLCYIYIYFIDITRLTVDIRSVTIMSRLTLAVFSGILLQYCTAADRTAGHTLVVQVSLCCKKKRSL